MSAPNTAPALLFVLALCCATQARTADKHWSYREHGGAAKWGELDRSFATCKLGKLQSPIDIRGAKPADLPAIKFDYKPSPLKIIDNGHTIQVNYAPGSSIDVGGARYELVQFHFHKPSEEKIDGKPHAMVVHLVHKGADGKLAVVAVLLDKGKMNPDDRLDLEKSSDREGKGSHDSTPRSMLRSFCPQIRATTPSRARSPRRRAARKCAGSC